MNASIKNNKSSIIMLDDRLEMDGMTNNVKKFLDFKGHSNINIDFVGSTKSLYKSIRDTNYDLVIINLNSITNQEKEIDSLRICTLVADLKSKKFKVMATSDEMNELGLSILSDFIGIPVKSYVGVHSYMEHALFMLDYLD